MISPSRADQLCRASESVLHQRMQLTLMERLILRVAKQLTILRIFKSTPLWFPLIYQIFSLVKIMFHHLYGAHGILKISFPWHSLSTLIRVSTFRSYLSYPLKNNPFEKCMNSFFVHQWDGQYFFFHSVLIIRKNRLWI